MAAGEGEGVRHSRQLSRGAILAWKIAAYEARLAGAEFIGPEHLLIGICSLEKALAADSSCGCTPTSLQILAEKEAVDMVLGKAGLNTRAMRRAVRDSLPGDMTPSGGRVIHRDAACKDVFARAEDGTVTGEVTVVRLLASLFTLPGKAAEEAARGAAARIVQAAGEYLDAADRASLLSLEITGSRNSLMVHTPGPAAGNRLRQELAQKSAQLALLCLGNRDLKTLIPALQDLATGDPAAYPLLPGIIDQLGYMKDERIMLDDRTAAMLAEMVRAAGTGGGQR